MRKTPDCGFVFVVVVFIFVVVVAVVVVVVVVCVFFFPPAESLDRVAFVSHTETHVLDTVAMRAV